MNLLNEDVEYIITKINDDSINFNEIPVCFKNNSKIVFAILKNNIGITIVKILILLYILIRL